MREFNRSRAEPVRFKMDGDVFDAVPEIPAHLMRQLAEKFGSAAEPTNPADVLSRYDDMLAVMRQLLVPDSREVFERRLSDGANPISLPQLQDLIVWLMGEVYGARPTPPPSPSPAPPSDGGQPSTDGAPPTISTSSTWSGPAI